MRITTYKSYINQDFHNYLVKESSTNYSKLDRLDTPLKVCEVMREVFHIHKCAEEQVFMISLNTKNVPTAFFQISKGSVSTALVSTRELFIQALLSSAVRIIICHNHPSQDVSPSKEDSILTQKIQDAGRLLDISLTDHLIIGDEHYYSFSEHKLL